MTKLSHFLCFLFLIHFSWSQNRDSLIVSRNLEEAIRNPQSSGHYLNQVDSLLSINQRNSSLYANLLALKVKYFLRTGQIDQAKVILPKALKKYSKFGREKAMFISLKGSVLATEKKFDEAILHYKESLVIYDSLRLEKEAAYIKNNIANVFFNLNDFESAYSYAKESFEEVYRRNDTIYYPQIASILSIAEAKLKRTNDARFHANLAIQSGEKYKNIVAIILGNYALGDVLVEQKQWERAYQAYLKSVTLAQTTHTALYESFGRIGLLVTCNALKKYKEGIKHGEIALQINSKMGIHFSDYTIHDQLAIAYKNEHDFEKAYSHLKRANELYRSYNSKETNRTIQELLTKYETEKKAKALRKRELELSVAFLWIAILLFVLAGSVALIFWYKKRNQRKFFQLQVEAVRREIDAFVDGEQIERERLAADFHDGISSALTGLALQLNNENTSLTREQIHFQIQSIRNEVRAISKNMAPFNLKKEGWNKAFTYFASNLDNELFRIHFIPVYNEELLNNERGLILYRIIQELIQNTIKHASASECELLIEEQEGLLVVHYSDNGIGVDQEMLVKGNGWQSILRRLTAINGSAAFPAQSIGGFNVDIYLHK